MKTKDARSIPSSAQEDLRKKAVQAVLGGMKQKDAAQLFGVTRHSVGKWMAIYQEEGEKGLKAKKRGRPKGGTLLPWQAAQIAQAVKDKHPDQLKLPFYLWTRGAVADLIERRFGLSLSRWTAGRYLKRWGFTPQKPMRRAFERDPKAVKKWLDEEYPAIRKKAKETGAQIYWGDEMGLRSDHVTGRTYGLRGITPVVPGTGRRFGCNMISAITNRGALNFMVFDGKFNARVFLEFLRRLVKQVRRRIFLVVDSHPAHKSKKVRDWVTKCEGKIQMFFLPGYSPDLNPDEMLNQDVKSNALGRRRPHTQSEMIKDVRSYLRKRQRRPHLVKRYFLETSVRYAAI